MTPIGSYKIYCEEGANNGATIGFEKRLWEATDALRGSMDAAEYKHVVPGLIFLKYISESFEEQYARLEAERADGADLGVPDEYRALNMFRVPIEARWSGICQQIKAAGEYHTEIVSATALYKPEIQIYIYLEGLIAAAAGHQIVCNEWHNRLDEISNWLILDYSI